MHLNSLVGQDRFWSIAKVPSYKSGKKGKLKSTISKGVCFEITSEKKMVGTKIEFNSIQKI